MRFEKIHSKEQFFIWPKMQSFYLFDCILGQVKNSTSNGFCRTPGISYLRFVENFFQMPIFSDFYHKDAFSSRGFIR